MVKKRNFWSIALGHQGSADCMLNLIHPDGSVQKSPIEGPKWNALEFLSYSYMDSPKYPINIPVHSHYATMCEMIWKYVPLE